MKTILVYKFNYDSQTEVVSLIPPASAFTPMTRLIADENCFITDGVTIYNSIDVLNSELDKWHELEKSDYLYLFE